MRRAEALLFPNGPRSRLWIKGTQCRRSCVFATVDADDATVDEYGRVVLAAQAIYFRDRFRSAYPWLCLSNVEPMP